MDKVTVKWPQPLTLGTFKKRYKRFFADIEIQNQIEVAHVANTGSMQSCLTPDCDALVLPSQDPNRKLKWSLKALKSEAGSWIGVDTSVPSKVLAETILTSPSFFGSKCLEFKPEFKINAQTRLDARLLLEQNKQLFIELKNVTLAHFDTSAEQQVALFPDAVTERGQKHLTELIQLKKQGNRSLLIFMVQRTDCVAFKPAASIDPKYAELLLEAEQAGVEIQAWELKVTDQGVIFTGKLLPILL